MPHSARRLVLIIYAVILVVSGACVSIGLAQEEASGPAVSQHGNTSITFENAGTSGLPSARYQAFDKFVVEHPEIAEALARNPRLIGSHSFIESHGALADFLHAT